MENIEPATKSIESDSWQIIDNPDLAASSIKLGISDSSSIIEPKEDNQPLPSTYTTGQQSVPIEVSNIDDDIQQDDSITDVAGREVTASGQTTSLDSSANTVQLSSGSKKKKKSDSKK